MGETLAEIGFKQGIQPYSEGVYVKAPVFSFNKLKCRYNAWTRDEVYR